MPRMPSSDMRFPGLNVEIREEELSSGWWVERLAGVPLILEVTLSLYRLWDKECRRWDYMQLGYFFCSWVTL